MSSISTDIDASDLPEEQLRAGTYSLLAALLRSSPQQELITRLQSIGNENEEKNASAEAVDAIASAWLELKQVAENVNPQDLSDEYHSLFIGLGRGELIPYGSWYLTGFMMEKPLGELRHDLASLGYQRQDNISEPEDHVAALCEVMAMLITDPDVPLGLQRKFFDTHLGSWMEKFFNDLEQATAAGFYRPVGRLGYQFIKLEKEYLSMLS